MTKRKRQPTAEMMREQLRLAADEIIRLKTEQDWCDQHMVAGAWRVEVEVPSNYRPSWWRRYFSWLL